MLPPIHTEYFPSGGATALIFIAEDAPATNLDHAMDAASKLNRLVQIEFPW